MYRVRVQIVDAQWNVKTVEKEFRTETARDRWLSKAEARGALHAVLAFGDDETRWEECRVADLQPGDRVSGDEDALEAVRGTGELSYGDINWPMIRDGSQTVTGVQLCYGGVALISVAGERDAIRSDSRSPLVREVAKTKVSE